MRKRRIIQVSQFAYRHLDIIGCRISDMLRWNKSLPQSDHSHVSEVPDEDWSTPQLGTYWCDVDTNTEGEQVGEIYKSNIDSSG